MRHADPLQSQALGNNGEGSPHGLSRGQLAAMNPVRTRAQGRSQHQQLEGGAELQGPLSLQQCDTSSRSPGGPEVDVELDREPGEPSGLVPPPRSPPFSPAQASGTPVWPQHPQEEQEPSESKPGGREASSSAGGAGPRRAGWPMALVLCVLPPWSRRISLRKQSRAGFQCSSDSLAAEHEGEFPGVRKSQGG